MSKLYLVNKNSPSIYCLFFLFRSEVTRRLQGHYALKIKFESETSKKTFDLNYSGTKTILDIKTDLYSLTKVPVRHQVWSGWPPNINDQSMIALSGIG